VGVPLIHRNYLRRILKNKAVRSNAMILTFDDGPSDRLTRNLTDLLDANNARATFFPLGRNITGREKIVRQVREQGHEICSHGYDHLHYWKVSPMRALKDIKRGWDAIDAALGLKRNKYPFRPPYGKLNIVCLLYLMIQRVPIIYWTQDSGDTCQSCLKNQSIQLLKTNAGGAVTLIHDFNRAEEKTEQLVLESVRLALVEAKEKQMRVMTVSELLNGIE
jgi:peptidoglycan/xylan/chitin deacetylase (PgdA/CDA1 family)